MKTRYAVALVALLAVPATDALAAKKAHKTTSATPPTKDGMNIAAIVGDEAISSYDVDNRIKFIIVNIPNQIIKEWKR